MEIAKYQFCVSFFWCFFVFFFLNFWWIVHSQQLLTYSYCAQYAWTIFVSFLLYLFCLFVVIYGFWSRHGNIWHDLCLFSWRNCLPYLRLFCKPTNYQQLILFNASLSVYKYIDIEHCCNCLQSLFKTRKFNGGPKCHSNEGIQTFVRYY